MGYLGRHYAKMWATWANLGPRQGQNCAQIGPTSANNNNNKKNKGDNDNHNNNNKNNHNKKQGRQRQPQQQQPPPRAKTGANLCPNTTTTTPTPARADGSAFAGARLSGVSLINPGAGPGPQPVSLPEAFGGNRKLYTAAPPAADPPRTYLRPIPPRPRSTIIVVIYSVFCVWCSKNIVFYKVLWPSPGFILATLKNHGFFMVLGLRKGSGTENWTSCRPWCQHRANIGQDVGYMGQHKAKIGASLRQHRANIGQDVGYMGRHKG